MRICRKCHAEKAISEFKKDSTCANGYRHICVKCFRIQQSERHAMKKSDATYKARITASRRKWDLKSKYGLTEAAYCALMEKQLGCCAICGQPDHAKKRLSIDHCHASGRIRGLLCSGCNHGLGKFLDNPELLRKAADYLR